MYERHAPIELNADGRTFTGVLSKAHESLDGAVHVILTDVEPATGRVFYGWMFTGDRDDDGVIRLEG